MLQMPKVGGNVAFHGRWGDLIKAKWSEEVEDCGQDGPFSRLGAQRERRRSSPSGPQKFPVGDCQGFGDVSVDVHVVGPVDQNDERVRHG